MNVTELVAKAATHAGFRHTLRDTGSRLTGIYTKDQRILLIQYRLFGGMGGQRLCRFYGKDDGRHINWGIENAHVKALIEIEGGATSWTTVRAFEGTHKKRQVLAYLKESVHDDDV